MTLEYVGRCGWVLCKDDALSSVRDLGVCGFQYPRRALSHSLWLPQDDWVTADRGAGGEVCASCSHVISTVWELRLVLTRVSHRRPGGAVTPVQVSCSVVFGSLQSIDCSTPGFPVYHQFLELTQTHDHPTISSSVVPFSFRLQSFPASGSFPVSHFFTSGGQSTGVSASASVLPVNIQD